LKRDNHVGCPTPEQRFDDASGLSGERQFVDCGGGEAMTMI
jgi:hypothetical protein